MSKRRGPAKTLSQKATMPLNAPPPRNSVTRALVTKQISVGTGKHGKSERAERRAAKVALQKSLTA
jgi:hypothetical protein